MSRCRTLIGVRLRFAFIATPPVLDPLPKPHNPPTNDTPPTFTHITPSRFTDCEDAGIFAFVFEATPGSFCCLIVEAVGTVGSTLMKRMEVSMSVANIPVRRALGFEGFGGDLGDLGGMGAVVGGEVSMTGEPSL